MEIFDDNENQVGNIENDGKERDEKDIDIPTIDSYSYAIAIICMYKKKQDATNCLKSLVLSHLYHFLCIADDTGVLTTYDNYYN